MYEPPSDIPPEVCRRGEWPCCAEKNATGGRVEADHWFLTHRPTFPRFVRDSVFLLDGLPPHDQDGREMYVSMHGRVLSAQLGPFRDSWDAVVENVHDPNAHHSVLLSSEHRHERRVPPVQAMFGSWGGARLAAAVIRRPDPLFRDLPCSRRW